MTIDVTPPTPALAHAAFTVQTSADPPLGLVILAGELDRDSAPQLLAALAVLARTAPNTWLIDAAAVTFCDAGGLRALATAASMAGDHGGELWITASSRCVYRLLTLIGLGHLLRPGAAAPHTLTPTPTQLAI